MQKAKLLQLLMMQSHIATSSPHSAIWQRSIVRGWRKAGEEHNLWICPSTLCSCAVVEQEQTPNNSYDDEIAYRINGDLVFDVNMATGSSRLPWRKISHFIFQLLSDFEMHPARERERDVKFFHLLHGYFYWDTWSRFFSLIYIDILFHFTHPTYKT